MQYFINMAGAEEELYKKWKEITLNSTGSDQVCSSQVCDTLMSIKEKCIIAFRKGLNIQKLLFSIVIMMIRPNIEYGTTR